MSVVVEKPDGTVSKRSVMSDFSGFRNQFWKQVEASGSNSLFLRFTEWMNI